MLKINNICKSYNGQRILNNISIEVQKNLILGFAGASGSGKSTLLRCIQRLEGVDSGSIYCDEKIGFMFQDFQLFPHMSVMQNLLYAPLLNKMDDAKSNAERFLEKLGMQSKANSYPAQLSGGQRQRVALARSLMMHPSLLLCDEPTSGLDIATIRDVTNLLLSVRDMGITMIIASHDLDFLSQVSDRIILIKNGSIAIDINTKDFEKHFLLNHY
ncbi:putative amino acid ABC transporter ATP-binding protein [Candidatus Cyrtobacter comes]|uniref:Amino acid ABC transporter ATP-binding protein n=1 Tax=Candidatus Cyrtobacter comes TaxID=675776 RepID=A0ABU5L806_9RICK|nr:ATP-binding cassette domain-containing protein [Candidatus Cyrtobacter comes]MDZ5762010.1 putative amino acid ABC transporter ATP-binding protein [Candidatus Cyrtobacter comes]